jgi:ribosome-associated protein
MTMIETDSDDFDLPEGPSKSELKRQMQDRQKLGEKLARLNKQQLATIPLDTTLLEAITDYQRFKHNEARRRQMQFVGKLMRDADIEAIEHAYELTQAGSEASKKVQHKLELWRDRLVKEGDAAINNALLEFPQLDRQIARQLIREAQKEQKENKAPAASRKLFKYLKEEMDKLA